MRLKLLPKKSTWSLKITSFFDFCRLVSGMSQPHPTTRKLLERKAAWCEESTPLKESHNSHFKPQENFAKFLVTLQAEGVQ